jgi:ribonuclease BN (tRNA processing enzyme)
VHATLVGVRLTVLGCSGSAPGPGAAASGYLVEADGFRMVVDFGNGVLSSLQSHCDAFAVDAMVLSHLHADHCADVSVLAVIRRYHSSPPYDPRKRRLPVYAPAEAPTRLAAIYAASAAEQATTDLSDVFDFHRLCDDTIHIGPFEVTAAQVTHPCEAFGFRITHAGTALVYTGDSGPCAALLNLAAGADVLLAESSWTKESEVIEDLHLSGRQAGALAAVSGVGRLLLTHVMPWTDAVAVLAEAQGAFSGPVELVKQDATYVIGGP